MISVLLSAFNESANPFFWKTLDTIGQLKNEGFPIEVLVGAGESTDTTVEKLDQRKIHTFFVKGPTRASRFNYAFHHASCKSSDWIVLNHPRSYLGPEAFLALTSISLHYKWGAFTHQFDVKHPLLDFTSWWSNSVRGDIKNIFYLDHCIFIRRHLFESIGGVPEIEIFEDTVLSQRLGKFHAPIRLPWKSTTSAIRFTKTGIWQQACKNQILKLQYFMGKDHNLMNEMYEKGINLNCD